LLLHLGSQFELGPPAEQLGTTTPAEIRSFRPLPAGGGAGQPGNAQVCVPEKRKEARMGKEAEMRKDAENRKKKEKRR
jgi:hypothetical protein